MYVKRSHIIVAAILAAFIAGAVFTGGIIFASGHNWLSQGLAASQVPQAGKDPEGAMPGVGPDTIADAVASAAPAVVKIDTTMTSDVNNPFYNDPFFQDFFGNQPQTRTEQALGSGFLISADGYLLTNEHVIEGAQQIDVTIMGKSKPITAQVVGSDRELDLAVLKIDAGSKLPFLKLGDSDQIRVGDWAIAIGNPYGLDHTVTVGVISAKGRPITVEDRNYTNLLQTDASINPGNSGGPLLDLSGEVIGINAAVSTEAQGIGFAIPSNTVNDVLSDLMKQGHVSRAWLGVEIQDVTQDVASAYGYNGTNGVVVRAVIGGGPAASANLAEGDIITGWNGSPVANTNDLLNKIKQAGAGTKVQLTIWRDQNTIQVNVTLAERSDSTS